MLSRKWIIITLLILLATAVAISMQKQKQKMEPFITNDEVVAGMHNKRMQKYATLLAPFFGQGTAQNAATATSSFFVTWSPTIAEIADVALQPQQSNSEQPELDDLACVEREILLPPSAVVPSDGAVYESAKSSDNCQVYIGDCSYAMRKVALNVRCYLDPPASSSRSPHLVMSRSHVATRTLMLLRPCAVRVGADGPMCQILWDTPGTDGISYDSASSSSDTAKLAVDIPVFSFDSDASATKVLGDKLVICYYLSYTGPRMGIPADTPRQVATVVFSQNTPQQQQQQQQDQEEAAVKDAAGGNVLRYTAATRRYTSSTLQTQSVNISLILSTSNSVNVSHPVWPGSCVIATWATDCLVIACLSRDRVTLVRQPVPRCSYLVANPNEIDAPPPGAPKSVKGLMRSTALPNLADIATRLFPPDSSVKQLSAMMSSALKDDSATRHIAATPLAPASLGSVMNSGPEYAMRPGSTLTSPNGVWTLEFLPDGRLVIRNRAFPSQPREVGSAQPPLRDAVTPLLCYLDDDTGALSLVGEVAPGSGNRVTYWTSRVEVPDPTPPGTGSPPFVLRMTDKGSAEVWGRFANVPVWSSSI